MALEKLREGHPIDSPPFRIALVTARDIEFCDRPINTLREWGIRLDRAVFCADMSKSFALAALNPSIFFDDSTNNCDDAVACTPTVRIPTVADQTFKVPAVILSSAESLASNRPDRFLGVCKMFLRKSFDDHESELRQWQQEHLTELSDDAFESFAAEFERSAIGTPAGKQRRAASVKNEDFAKLLRFAENLKRKYSA